MVQPALPLFQATELERHLSRFAAPETCDRLFVGEKGGPLRSLTPHNHWSRARTEAGLPEGFRFHDLRHTANTITAATGASTRELMHRMGNASSAAALRYQNATQERDNALAQALDELATRARSDVRRAVEGSA
jgi:integrase